MSKSLDRNRGEQFYLVDPHWKGGSEGCFNLFEERGRIGRECGIKRHPKTLLWESLAVFLTLLDINLGGLQLKKGQEAQHLKDIKTHGSSA